MSTIIATSLPLVVIDSINRLDLLFRHFDKVEIPESVYKEAVLRGSSIDVHASTALKKYIDDKKLLVVELNESAKKISAEVLKKGHISEGLADAIGYAIVSKISEVFADGCVERKLIRSFNLIPVSPFRIILLSYKNKILNAGQVKDLINNITKSVYKLDEEALTIFWEKFDRLKKVMATLSEEI